jgi:transposase
MGQVLHGCATTTEAVRRAIQNSQESLRALAKRYGINQKTVAKWKQRENVSDRPTGPKEAKSTVLSIEEEAIIVAFRRHTLLPLDDCLYALQPTIPHLTRSSLHRCLQRHGISRLPETGGPKPSKKKFKTYPIGYFHIDLAKLQTAEGKLYLYVAIDRTSKFAFVQLVKKTGRSSASAFLEALIAAVPYKIHTVLTDNGIQFTFPPRYADGPTTRYMNAYVRYALPGERNRTSADQDQASLDQWPGRAHEPDDQGSDRPTLSLRPTRSARSTPFRLHQRLQLRSAAEDPEGPHALRIHLQMLDFPARTIQTQSAPANAGTKQLGRLGWVICALFVFIRFCEPFKHLR